MSKFKVGQLVYVTRVEQPINAINRHSWGYSPRKFAETEYHVAVVEKSGTKYITVSYLDTGNFADIIQKNKKTFTKQENGSFQCAYDYSGPSYILTDLESQNHINPNFTQDIELHNARVREHNEYESMLYEHTKIQLDTPHPLGYWTTERITKLKKLQEAAFVLDELTREFKKEQETAC